MQNSAIHPVLKIKEENFSRSHVHTHSTILVQESGVECCRVEYLRTNRKRYQFGTLLSNVLLAGQSCLTRLLSVESASGPVPEAPTPVAAGTGERREGSEATATAMKCDTERSRSRSRMQEVEDTGAGSDRDARTRGSSRADASKPLPPPEQQQHPNARTACAVLNGSGLVPTATPVSAAGGQSMETRGSREYRSEQSVRSDVSVLIVDLSPLQPAVPPLLKQQQQHYSQKTSRPISNAFDDHLPSGPVAVGITGPAIASQQHASAAASQSTQPARQEAPPPEKPQPQPQPPTRERQQPKPQPPAPQTAPTPHVYAEDANASRGGALSR